MKSFKTFRLDTANHLLWRNGDRIPITPKAFDVLSYLVKHAGRVVTQDEVLEALWLESYVNPEVLRKYILEIRKALGDRPDNPEFIETVPKRGYRFIAPVVEENATELLVAATLTAMQEPASRENTGPAAVSSEQKSSLGRYRLWQFAVLLILASLAAAAIAGRHFQVTHVRVDTALPKNTSIAVLPFANLSAAKDQEYFSDGLAEQLINDLAKLPGLKVAGRSSAFQFKGRDEDLREVGRKLGVANVLEGSVRRNGNHVRITAELNKADDGFQLWSQTYDREIKDIFGVEDDIAQSATEALSLKLLGNRQPVASNLHNTNPEAYQAYLQAKYFSGRGQSEEDFDKAVAYTDKAIELDKKYAPAWALRAAVRNMMAEGGLTDMTEGFRKARDDEERAIALDPTLDSAYVALAATQMFYDWDWNAADTSLTKAVALAPGNVDIVRIRAELSLALGNLDQATQLYRQVVALDPLRTNSYLTEGQLLQAEGRYDEAQAALQKALDLNPQVTFAHYTRGQILIAQGKPQLGLTEIEKEPCDWERLTGEGMVYNALGREHDSNAALARLIAKHGTIAAYQIAQVYAFREESDKSFEWLERAYKQRDAGLAGIKTDPLFNNLRHDPRYTELLEKMHLPA
jgi:TolB-like protein/DNA-binding winged helix-turn-helix (wHTH) protein/Tfp pilus assembly protein PilF